MTDVVTLADLRASARDRADMVNSTFITDAQFNEYIDLSYGDFYDLLIDEGHDFYIRYTDVNVGSGNEIDLSVLVPDFYRLRGIDDMTNPDYPLTVRRYNFAERNDFRGGYTAQSLFSDVLYNLLGEKIFLTPPSIAPRPYRLWFVPERTRLAVDGDSINSFNGWVEWIILDAAIKAKVKEESDIKGLLTLKQAQYERLAKAKPKRDSTGPTTISRVRNKNINRIIDSRIPPSFGY